MGQFVNESGVARGIGRIHGGRVYAFQADSHEKAQQRGRQDISHLVDMLSVRPREESIESGGWVGGWVGAAARQTGRVPLHSAGGASPAAPHVWLASPPLLPDMQHIFCCRLTPPYLALFLPAAHRLYKLALTHGFTRGRRTNQVAAAALYLVCRQDSKPFLLIDFSDALQVNVFTLGAVFLQLAKLLRLNEHPMFAK